MDDRTKVKSAKALEHRLLKIWKESIQARPAIVLVAVSGGVDSIYLLHFLHKWQRLLKIDLAIAHIHHGLDASAKTLAYRNRTMKLVSKWAQKNQVPLYVNTPEVSGCQSEAEWREYRWKWLRQWQSEIARSRSQAVCVATAHTADDLLETRLLRLIRGTGPQGLRAMTVQDQDVIRPLLNEPKVELIAAARALKLSWCDDPSNQNPDFLRNWLRTRWLKALDKQIPAARKNMANSLQNLVDAVEPGLDSISSLIHTEGIDRRGLTKLPRKEQRQVIARYLRLSGCASYTSQHVEEIMKRLDKTRRDHTFVVLDQRCHISNQWIRLSYD